MAAAKVFLTINEEDSRLSFRAIRFSGASVTFQEIGRIAVRNVTSIILGNLTGRATLAAGVPVFDTKTGNIFDGTLTATNINIENDKSERLASGGGTIKLSNLSSKDISADTADRVHAHGIIMTK
jgi:hypothetical protein